MDRWPRHVRLRTVTLKYVHLRRKIGGQRRANVSRDAALFFFFDVTITTIFLRRRGD